ncbi:shikimate dehydrogenase [Arthrobacter pascens]|uniref:shikimate dehydrogenase n=1 Tax=Arthrobacter pascens TaxID=1677 RepID=UPI00196B1D57|nr:shikimate dehydrogenase [Arthrobacter pascens]MBN3498762.1 shikimate dehydrogenase [Arthrobacter pascens]MDR6556728.1 shikimate dehydrogenase [Arthrobacter pascens]
MSRRAAVLGHPIGHSKSPALHLAAYAQLGEDIGYSAIDVTEESLPAFMASIRGEEGWRGLSVTMPLKKAMVREVDEVRGVARVLGVINTVVFDGEGGSGRRIGYNTDVAGIVNALRNAGAAEAPAAAVLGGGGTAAAAVAALQELGATSVDVYVRDTGRAAEARAAARGLAMDIAVRPMTEAVTGMLAADVVISTLPPRAADGMAAELEQLGRATQGVLLDVAYDPWPSRIAAAWRNGGGKVVPGLEMLLYQAVEQVRHFTGREDAASAEVIDVMCDAVGAPRRVF